MTNEDHQKVAERWLGTYTKPIDCPVLEDYASPARVEGVRVERATEDHLRAYIDLLESQRAELRALARTARRGSTVAGLDAATTGPSGYRGADALLLLYRRHRELLEVHLAEARLDESIYRRVRERLEPDRAQRTADHGLARAAHWVGAWTADHQRSGDGRPDWYDVRDCLAWWGHDVEDMRVDALAARARRWDGWLTNRATILADT